MHIQVNPGDVVLSDAINTHVHEQVASAMRNFEQRITRVEVHLHDDNGPKSGIDKRCTMEARIAGLQPVAVEHHAPDLYDAVTGAAGRLERAVRNRLERQQSHRSSH